MRGNLRLPRGKPLKLALAISLLDICALVTQLLALQSWLLSLASIMISLYPSATVVLAMVVLRERLSRWQGIGMVMAMGSVAMIAAN
jgi:drug/metabolite transporter (DMT)-like permease